MQWIESVYEGDDWGLSHMNFDYKIKNWNILLVIYMKNITHKNFMICSLAVNNERFILEWNVLLKICNIKKTILIWILER